VWAPCQELCFCQRLACSDWLALFLEACYWSAVLLSDRFQMSGRFASGSVVGGAHACQKRYKGRLTLFSILRNKILGNLQNNYLFAMIPLTIVFSNPFLPLTFWENRKNQDIF
jgi:hypothetical protein